MERIVSKGGATIQWGPRFSVGIAEVDREHQQFLSLANDLVVCIADGKSKPEVQRLLRLLVKDAVSHFDHEERLFQRYGYPEAAQHIAIHATMRKRLAGAIEELDAAGPGTDWSRQATEIRQFLVDHMLKEDLKYVGYLS